jgi:hypothetical protein
MPYGSHASPCHRAPATGGSALLNVPLWPTGLHRRSVLARRPARRHTPREPQRPMQVVMSGLGTLILMGICGLSAFFIVADERRGHGDGAATADPISVSSISSRRVDAKPLSLREVFPDSQVRLVAGAAPYQVVMTHIDTDCQIATTGTLGALLDDRGCSQVVRAAMTAPYGGYRVTAGLFNLDDEAGATLVDDEVGRHVEAGDGSFAAMASGLPGADPTTQPPSQVGWHARGHYLIYCVISRPDGQVVRDDDPYAGRITADLVQSYIGGTIIGKRSLNP